MSVHRYISDELFHFVGRCAPNDHERNYEILADILASECVSHPPHTPGPGKISTRMDLDKGLTTEELIVPSVVCFCDIPHEHLSTHVSKYGLFGLSFEKPMLVRRGARPVMYVPTYSTDTSSIYGKSFLRNIEAIYRGFLGQVVEPLGDTTEHTRAHRVKPDSRKEAILDLDSVFVRDFMAFLKPFDSDLPGRHQDQFYAEREWRMYGNLSFDPADVVRVHVANGYRERVEHDFPQFSEKIDILADPGGN